MGLKQEHILITYVQINGKIFIYVLGCDFVNIRRYTREYLKVEKLGDGNMEERYCSIEESLRESLKQMQLMKKGVIPKKTWKEFCLEVEEEQND